MKDIEQLTYAAVITITLPGAELPTSFTLTLAPSDAITLSGGTAKLLQDCTLGELSRFADELEEELLAIYRESTLVDLAIDGEAAVEIQYLKNDPDLQPSSEMWLEQVVILPESDLADTATEKEQADDANKQDLTTDPESDSTRSEAVASHAQDEPEELAKQAEDQSIDAGITEEEDEIEADIKASESPISEIDDRSSDEGSIDRRDEALVNVAEAELVHEEREAEVEPAAEESTIVEEIARVRILGRRRPLNHPTWTAVDILINEPAFRDAQAHAISNLEREVAGILVGPPPEKQPDGRYVVHVSNTIIAKHTRMQGASVTYTPESWRYIHDKLAVLYPNDEAVIVGWYHTHPGFGIFLSGMDQFIHQNFFTQIWHIALVLDPRAHKSGFFCWDRQQTRVDPYEFPWPTWALGSW